MLKFSYFGFGTYGKFSYICIVKFNQYENKPTKVHRTKN